MSPRYKKVINDLRADLSKNLMLVVAIAIGVFGVGTILGGYAVLKREMSISYMSTNPASATIKLDEANPIDRALVDEVRKHPGVKTAERHATIYARMKIGKDWRPLLIFVKDDFKNMLTNKVTYISGAITPATGTMLTERTAYRVMQSIEQGSIIIKTPHGEATSITLTGTVHDPGLAPAWQEETGYGYMTMATLNELDGTRGFDELRIVVSNANATMQEISAKAEEVAGWLEQKGYLVHEIQVPPPKRHPHQSQMNAILSMFTVFSFMILILGCILVASSISTLMVKQVRQIGIMKTIGANSRQIAWLYFIMILMISLMAVLIAIPLSRLAAEFFYVKIATLLNIHIFDPTIPHQVMMVQILCGVVIPLLAVAFPVLKGSRIKVREAIENYGVSNQTFGQGFLDKLLSRFTFFGEVGTLSLRNVFRRRSRLIMALGLLAAGGAMFMTALNISESWDTNLQKIHIYRHYDLEVRLNDYITPDTLLSKIKEISNVKEAEAWNYSSTSFTRESQFEIVNTYPDKGHGSFILLELPVPTTLLNLPIQQGKWLSDSDSRDVVLNQISRALMPTVKLGDTISLSVDNRPEKWRVVGIVEDIGSPATVFVSIQNKATKTGNMLRIAYNDRNGENALKTTRAIENLLSQEKISVNQSIPVSLLHNAMAEHMGVLVSSLLSMAILMALIGALGLMSSMSMNIMERTREIGVMRAIGATPNKIRRLVMVEGLVTGLISIFLAFGLSLPLSYYIGKFIGNMAFRTPLSLSISAPALAIWIAIIVSGSIAATLYPAQNAVRITTREALAYE